jgi:hypothetical protein
MIGPHIDQFESRPAETDRSLFVDGTFWRHDVRIWKTLQVRDSVFVGNVVANIGICAAGAAGVAS